MPIINPHPIVACEKPLPFVGVITDCAAGEPYDLTSATGVVLRFRKAGTCVALFELAGVISTPTDGRVSFDWGANLVGLTKGRYEGEVVAQYAGGRELPIFKTIQFELREAF
jgi:hypothetical protein